MPEIDAHTEKSHREIPLHGNTSPTSYAQPLKSAKLLNSQWPMTILRRRTTLVQEKACCLTGPSYYPNQCWLNINRVLWHSPRKFHTQCSRYLSLTWVWTYFWFVIAPHLPGTNEYDVILGAIASQITNLTIVFSTVYLDTDQRNHQSSASLAFLRGIHRSPVNSPHKWPVTRKNFPFDDVIMCSTNFNKALQNQAPRLYKII